jgi:hypothetical protein
MPIQAEARLLPAQNLVRGEISFAGGAQSRYN